MPKLTELSSRPDRGLTEAKYIAAEVPGKPRVPKGIIAAAWAGWRWGRIEHRLLDGRLTRPDAEWLVNEWRDGIPV